MLRSLPARGAWVEILEESKYYGVVRSLPARGAWVEIRRLMMILPRMITVAPREGSVG